MGKWRETVQLSRDRPRNNLYGPKIRLLLFSGKFGAEKIGANQKPY